MNFLFLLLAECAPSNSKEKILWSWGDLHVAPPSIHLSIFNTAKVRKTKFSDSVKRSPVMRSWPAFPISTHLPWRHFYHPGNCRLYKEEGWKFQRGRELTGWNIFSSPPHSPIALQKGEVVTILYVPPSMKAVILTYTDRLQISCQRSGEKPLFVSIREMRC